MEQKIFLIYSVDDKKKAREFQKKAEKHRKDLKISDVPVSLPFTEDSGDEIKSKISELIRKSDTIVCLVGKCTYMNQWVDWEIKQCMKLKKRIIAVRIHGSIIDRTPDSLDMGQTKIFEWDVEEIAKAM